MTEIKVGGLETSSFSDWKGEVCAVLFTSGCNLRCRYCRNIDLVDGMGTTIDTTKKFMEKVATRMHDDCVEHLCITGGEPLHQPEGLEWALNILKDEGILVKLDTNGTYASHLKKIVKKKLIKALSVDIKAPLRRDEYRKVTQSYVNIESVKETFEIAKDEGLPLEVRMTVFPEYHTESVIAEMLDEAYLHTNEVIVQPAKLLGCLDRYMDNKPAYEDWEIRGILCRRKLA